MRLKRGSRVEVLKKNDVPFSWGCAEIMSGNGHTYSVRYDCHLGMPSEEVVERVTRKSIRPCPPPVEALNNWVAGDVVEMLDAGSWRISTILKVSDGDYYFVRQLGSPQQFRVHQSNIRVRQCWQDGNWVVIKKVSLSCGNVKSKKLLTSNCYQKASFHVPQSNAKIKLPPRDERIIVGDTAGLLESHIFSSRTLKRASPYCSCSLEAYTGKFQKTRAIEKEGKNQRVGHTPLMENVTAVSYPRENLGEKYMHASFNNRSNGYNELERGTLNGVEGHSLVSLDSNDSDSDACSVGSCSVANKSPNKGYFVPIPCEETDTLSSYAESCNLGGDDGNYPLPSQEEVAESIHWLELHAYRCTLDALYASGHLSWEQEIMLTDLRIMLHISNDEHLMELRKLISYETGVHVR